MSNVWRDEQHPSFINFISNFLCSNSFRLNFVPIAPVIFFSFTFSVCKFHWHLLYGVLIPITCLRTWYSIVVVYQWLLLSWQVGSAVIRRQSLAGSFVVYGFSFLLVFPLVLFDSVRSWQSSKVEEAICKFVCCCCPSNQGAKWFICSILLQVIRVWYLEWFPALSLIYLF